MKLDLPQCSTEEYSLVVYNKLHNCEMSKRSHRTLFISHAVGQHSLRKVLFAEVTWTCCAHRNYSTAISWNVNSLRALCRNNPTALTDLVQENNADVLCLQETKLQKCHEEQFVDLVDPSWSAIFNSSTTRLGYSGTAVLSKQYPDTVYRSIGHVAGDAEGRLTTVVLNGAFVVCVYTMNAGLGLKRLPLRLSWDAAFRRHIRHLRSLGKPVIVLGDLNVARSELDVYDSEECRDIPGFSEAERESFEETLESCGLVDVFRERNPAVSGTFTAWEYRTRARGRNDGVRIDYALVSEDIVGAVRDVRILDSIEGSDHCPVAIDLYPGFL